MMKQDCAFSDVGVEKNLCNQSMLIWLGIDVVDEILWSQTGWSPARMVLGRIHWNWLRDKLHEWYEYIGTHWNSDKPRSSGVQQVDGSINFQSRIVDRRRPCLSGYIRQVSGHLRQFWYSDAIVRSMNSIGMLRCAPSTTSDPPQLGADGQVPIISGLWCNPDLTTETACWSVFRYTWYVASSWCRTQPHGWFVDFDASIM